MSNNPHALVTRQIVGALLRLPRDEQRRFMAASVDYLRRESFTDVASVYDFIMAPSTPVLTDARREELLGIVARAARENDMAILMPAPAQL